MTRIPSVFTQTGPVHTAPGISGITAEGNFRPASARIKSGSVPQHPPRIPAPAAASSSIAAAKASASTPYSPVTGSGRPALGLAITGSVVLARISRTMGIISRGPREQLTPTASAPSPSRVLAMDAGVHPVNVRPVLSKLMVTNTGRSVSSLAAIRAARVSVRSLMVSMAIRSAPASAPAFMISLYRVTASSKGRDPSGSTITPRGPTSSPARAPVSAAHSFAIRIPAAITSAVVYPVPFSFRALAPNVLA